MQQVEQVARAVDGLGHGPHGHRVVQVAAGRGVRQQQVVADQVATIVARPRTARPSRGPSSRDHRDPGVGVVAGKALADVVQQRAEQQQVGPGHVAGERGGLGRGLDQVPVDGEPVHRVALRVRRAPAPSPGSAATSSPAWSSASSTGTARRPGAEQVDERVAGPRPATGDGSGADSVASRSSACGASGRPARAAAPAARSTSTGSVARVGVAGQHDLAALLDHAVGERARAAARRPPAGGTRSAPAGGGRQLGSTRRQAVSTA